MAESAVLLNIGDMIDLAIGTPEVGVVDFNMLQTVLHCLAQQLRVLGKSVELRGSVAALPVGRDNLQTIAIQEYRYDAESAGKKEMTPAPPPPEPEPTLLVVERIRKSDSPETRTPFEASGGPTPRAHSPPKVPSMVVSKSPPEKLSLVTLSKFNLLEGVVEDLKNRVYGSMPKNEEILEEVRSQTNLKAITDMWTSLNVSSRLEAAEAGISKLSSLVQDLIAEINDLQKNTSKTPAPAVSVMAPPPKSTKSGTGPPGATKEELASIQGMLERLRADLDRLTEVFYKTVEEIQAGLDQPLPVAPVTSAPAPTPQPEPEPKPAGRRLSVITADIHDRINGLERDMKKCCDSLTKNEGIIQDQLNSFQDQLEYLARQVANITQDLSAGKLSPDLIKDLQGLMQLFKTVQEMQEQLKEVHDTALQLAAEKEDRQHHINALLEQIELLKTIKLDREDMVEALADKADMRMLARKVSHDQFEMACDDLSRGLEHAIGKLSMQEALWQQALDDIQREIESKLDKVELSPVKEFFNSKLKQLQENLKQMAAARREAEAAGTKRRLLRDVNCISCDANAVMPMEAAAALPVSKPLPATLSMKPYLSYELDAIRKSQASNLPQRNMHDWETIDKQAKQPPQRVRSETDKHLCNRYCGGSHTVTTAAQRVARLGHFIKQWGPDVLPLSSGLAAGDDGRMYKISPVEGAVNAGPGGAADATCTPRSPAKKGEPSRPSKPLVVGGAECRCLEEDRPPK